MKLVSLLTICAHMAAHGEQLARREKRMNPDEQVSMIVDMEGNVVSSNVAMNEPIVPTNTTKVSVVVDRVGQISQSFVTGSNDSSMNKPVPMHGQESAISDHLHHAVSVSTSSDFVEATVHITANERAKATARISAVSYEEGAVGQLGHLDPTGAVAKFAGDIPQYKQDLEDMGWSMTKRWTISTVGGSGQDDAEVWKKGNNRECILCFRGSDDADDFVRDVSVIPVEYEGLLDVSDGVAKELKPLVAEMKESDGLVKELAGCGTLTVTGHSLGGALASLFSALANKNEDPFDLGLTVDYLVTYGAIPVSQTPLQNDKTTSGCFEGTRYYNQKKFGLTSASVRSDFALWVGACWANLPVGCYRAPDSGPLRHPKVPGVSLFVKPGSAAEKHSRTCQEASDHPTDELVAWPLDLRSMALHAPHDYVANIGD